MARRKQSKGQCTFCGKEMTGGGLVRHLKTCNARQDAIAMATIKKRGKDIPIYHLQIKDAWNSNFWLHLEMNGTASLYDLDAYLRAIWLECCGHMSRFSLDGWGSPDIPMTRKLKDILTVGSQLLHQYDFGTTSETWIKAVDMRMGKPLSRHPIYLMARNNPPDDLFCAECGKPATDLCTECMWDEDDKFFFCDEHAETHEHDDMLLAVVNSPRMGMCGYDGPAEPPY